MWSTLSKSFSFGSKGSKPGPPLRMGSGDEGSNKKWGKKVLVEQANKQVGFLSACACACTRPRHPNGIYMSPSARHASGPEPLRSNGMRWIRVRLHALVCVFAALTPVRVAVWPVRAAV